MLAVKCPAITSVLLKVAVQWVNLSDCPLCMQHTPCMRVLRILHTQCIAYPFCCSCLSLQACQNGGGDLIFGIGSMNSAQIGDVSTSDWNFTMIYTNAAQGKTTHVAYTLATSGGTRFTFTSELPANTYVSWCSSFSIQLYYTSWVYCIWSYSIATLPSPFPFLPLNMADNAITWRWRHNQNPSI